MRVPKILIFLFCLCCCRLPGTAQDFLGAQQFLPSEIRGKNLKPVDKKSKEIVFNSPLHLFVLFSPECPLCKNYSGVITKIEKEFSGSLKVYGIIPGKSYPVKVVKKFAADYKMTFPFYIDPEKELTTYMNGTVTPEAILMNKEGNVIYRGAIDDWVVEVGKKKLSASNEYLKTAIEEYLQNKTVSIKMVEPKGCLINEF